MSVFDIIKGFISGPITTTFMVVDTCDFRFENGDIHRALSAVPGICKSEEEGSGLCPPIGIGTNGGIAFLEAGVFICVVSPRALWDGRSRLRVQGTKLIETAISAP